MPRRSRVINRFTGGDIIDGGFQQWGLPAAPPDLGRPVIDPVLAIYTPLDQGPEGLALARIQQSAYSGDPQYMPVAPFLWDEEDDEEALAEDTAVFQPQYGNDPLQQLGDALGGALGQAGGKALANPEVQASLQAAAETCRERAKTGVDEWIIENKENIALAATATVGVLLFGHWMLSVLALKSAFPRRAFREGQ